MTSGTLVAAFGFRTSQESSFWMVFSKVLVKCDWYRLQVDIGSESYIVVKVLSRLTYRCCQKNAPT